MRLQGSVVGVPTAFRANLVHAGRVRSWRIIQKSDRSLAGVAEWKLLALPHSTAVEMYRAFFPEEHDDLSKP